MNIEQVSRLRIIIWEISSFWIDFTGLFILTLILVCVNSLCLWLWTILMWCRCFSYFGCFLQTLDPYIIIYLLYCCWVNSLVSVVCKGSFALILFLSYFLLKHTRLAIKKKYTVLSFIYSLWLFRLVLFLFQILFLFVAAHFIYIIFILELSHAACIYVRLSNIRSTCIYFGTVISM